MRVVKRRELAVTGIMAANVLCIVGSYTMIKAVREAVFLARFDLTHLALLMIALAVFAGLAAATANWLSHGLPRSRLILVSHSIVILTLVALWLALLRNSPSAPWILYLWSSFFGLYVLANFWLLANELFDSRQAKRRFALLGAGAIGGGIVGGEASRALAESLGAVNLLPLSALGLMASAVLAQLAWTVGAPHRGPLSTPDVLVTSRSYAEGFRLLRRNRSLRLVALMLLLSTLATTLLDLQIKGLAKATFGSDRDAMAAFFGRLTAVFSAASLTVQLVVTTPFLRRFGVGTALLCLPISIALGTLVIAAQVILALPLVMAATLAKVGDGGLRFSLDKAAMELLYLPVPLLEKAKAKPVIDTVVDRAATGLVGFLWLALTLAAGIGVPVVLLATLAILGIVSAWIATVRRERAAYVETIRHALPHPTILVPSPDLTVPTDPAAITANLAEEMRTFARHQGARRALCNSVPGGTRALCGALASTLVRDRARLFSLLCLAYPERDILAAYQGLLSQDSAVRASALELLDNVVAHPLKRRLLTLLEEDHGRERHRGPSPAHALRQLSLDADPELRELALRALGKPP